MTGGADGDRRPVAVVADDEVHIAEIVAMVLAPLGFEVVKAYDGEQALRAVHERGARLVVSDVMMPKLGGDELCRRIKAGENGRETHVILLTSLSEESVPDCGADGYLRKPFEFEDLEALVGRLAAAPGAPGG
jgi:DNA-binding response OmpR family regulator